MQRSLRTWKSFYFRLQLLKSSSDAGFWELQSPKVEYSVYVFCVSSYIVKCIFEFQEWKAWLIALYYTVTLPLRTACLIIQFTIDELLSKFQDNVPQASYILEELQMALSTLECFQDLCWRIVTRVWERMLEEENLNALLNYVAQALPFCFFANYCKCRPSTNSTIRAIQAMQKMQASRESLLRLQEPAISCVTTAPLSPMGLLHLEKIF